MELTQSLVCRHVWTGFQRLHHCTLLAMSKTHHTFMLWSDTIDVPKVVCDYCKEQILIITKWWPVSVLFFLRPPLLVIFSFVPLSLLKMFWHHFFFAVMLVCIVSLCLIPLATAIMRPCWSASLSVILIWLFLQPILSQHPWEHHQVRCVT